MRSSKSWIPTTEQKVTNIKLWLKKNLPIKKVNEKRVRRVRGEETEG